MVYRFGRHGYRRQPSATFRHRIGRRSAVAPPDAGAPGGARRV